MNKTKSIMSWGQVFILVGTLFLFLFALTQRVNFENQQEVKFCDVSGYTFVGGTITAYSGEKTTLEIPSSYSYGETTTLTGSITFNNRNEAFAFLQENYAVGAEGYYDFYHQIYSQTYPWYYEYSINQYTYVAGNDIIVNNIADSAFKQNTNLEKIILPSTIETIENFAFQYCSNLKEIEFSEGLTFIGDSAFWGCGIIALNNLPDSLEMIYPYAFFSCEKLEEVTIPPNVTNMYLGTFNGCKNLKKVTILSKHEIEAWDTGTYHTFSNCSSLETIKIPKENLDYYSSTLPWSRYVDKYVTY